MKILVELNRKEEYFQLQEIHKERLVSEFPNHTFQFAPSYQEMKSMLHDVEAALVWIFPEKLFSKAFSFPKIFSDEKSTIA